MKKRKQTKDMFMGTFITKYLKNLDLLNHSLRVFLFPKLSPDSLKLVYLEVYAAISKAEDEEA